MAAADASAAVERVQEHLPGAKIASIQQVRQGSRAAACGPQYAHIPETLRELKWLLEPFCLRG